MEAVLITMTVCLTVYKIVEVLFRPRKKIIKKPPTEG